MSTINVEVIPGGVVSVNGQQGAVSLTLGVPGTGVSAIVAITQTAYDNLDPKVATTLYIVTPDPS
jgi:ABC-type molybdate transport system ATPase subunit